MPADAEPTDAVFTDPVGYSSLWLVVAVVLVGLVALYYLRVWAWSRGSDAPAEPSASPVEAARKAHLKELERLEAAVRSGRTPVRVGFQQLSATVRSFVTDVTDVPAHAMTLTELRESADPRVAEAVAAMYPPEFAPGSAEPDDFARSLREARELVASWT